MRLSNGIALLAGVDDENGAGQLLHFLYAAQILLQLFDLAQVLHNFLLGQHVKGAVFLHLLELGQTIHTAAHGLEVGEHTAQPTGIDIVLTAAGSFFLDGFLRLLLGADEQERAAVLRQVQHEVVSLFQLLDGFLQINNVDAVALRIDIGSHFGVPAAGLVTEVDASFEQLLHGYNVLICHNVLIPPNLVFYLQKLPLPG